MADLAHFMHFHLVQHSVTMHETIANVVDLAELFMDTSSMLKVVSNPVCSVYG